MDYQGALKFLGLSDSASSEDMVRAKNQMMSRYREEEDKLKKVSHVAKRRAMMRAELASFPRSLQLGRPFFDATCGFELRADMSCIVIV
jgi:hypothetical protein